MTSTTIELTPTKSAGELLTVRQAATFLGVGPATVYRMLKDGRLPVAPVMLGGEMRLSPRRTERWLDSPTEQPMATAARPFSWPTDLRSARTTQAGRR